MDSETKIQNKYKFPEGFLWGSATAAHQVEGNNDKSDWWSFEQSQSRKQELLEKKHDPKNYFSAIACDSYNRFDEDFAIAKSLNHNTHRLGIEWARIEPKEGYFLESELEHYEKVLQSAHFHGFKTFVTLHHFTSPLWFANKGAFLRKENIQYFVRFVERVVKRLEQYCDFFITINEPEMYASHAYLFGVWPPNQKSFLKTSKVISNLILAHNLSAQKIKSLSQKPVSMAYHLSDLQPTGILSSPTTYIAHYLANEYILSRTVGTCDFIGVNYYNHHHVGIFGFRKHSHSSHDKNDLGWGIHPEGIERVLLNLKKYNKPIYITENGVADAKDSKRERFIKDHLFFIHKAIQQGVDVRGYLHWSLIDNFEWEKGFGPRFGLVEIDREHNLERKIRKSALAYAEVCKNNFINYP